MQDALAQDGFAGNRRIPCAFAPRRSLYFRFLPTTVMTSITEKQPAAGFAAPGSVTSLYSSARKTAVLVILLLSWILANADRVAMSIAIIPITHEFQLSAESAGLVLSSFYISYALMQLGAGWLSDRMGSRAILVFSVACWSVFTAMTGAAGGLVSLLLIRVLFGIGEGGFVPASTVTVAEAFPVKERARAKSLVIGASLLGSAIGSGGIAALIHTYGWRHAYQVFGVVGIAVAIALWLIVKKSPRREAGSRVAGAFGTLLRSPVLRTTMIIFFCCNIVYVGLISWMPSFIIKTRHLDIVHVGAMSAVPYLIAFGFLNLVGWLLDKVGQGRERLFMVFGACMITVFLLLMAVADSLPVLLTFWTLCLIGYSFVYGTVFAIPLKHLPDTMVGGAAGIINFGGQLAAAVGPFVIGMLVDLSHGQFVLAFLFLLAAGIGAVVFSLLWKPARTPHPAG
jgi:ACS family hexuronate transporter-like MFS transporter